MSLTAKMEILGRVSERARDIEGDAAPRDAFLDAVHALADVSRHGWVDIENALEFVAATAVNWLQAGPGVDEPVEYWPAPGCER